MEKVKYLIVHSKSKNLDAQFGHTYLGMNRFRLGSFNDITEQLLFEGIGLEEVESKELEGRYISYIKKLWRKGNLQYDLLSLNKPEKYNEHDWEFLGFDVGENTPAAWSAILNNQVFTSKKDIKIYINRLNQFGLFDDFNRAEEFLQLYLMSDDPDRDWGIDDEIIDDNIYQVIPIYRFRKNY